MPGNYTPWDDSYGCGKGKSGTLVGDGFSPPSFGFVDGVQTSDAPLLLSLDGSTPSTSITVGPGDHTIQFVIANPRLLENSGRTINVTPGTIGSRVDAPHTGPVEVDEWKYIFYRDPNVDAFRITSPLNAEIDTLLLIMPDARDLQQDLKRQSNAFGLLPTDIRTGFDIEAWQH